MGATTHISDINVCNGTSLPQKQMKKGQNWSLKAHYDFDKFKGMQHDDGTWDEIMGIELLFVRRKNSGAV
jgi:hypothetical protein